MSTKQHEEDDFTLGLDVLVSNFGKRCRFATPLPVHLRSELRSAGYVDVLPSHASPSRSTASEGDRAQQRQHEERLAAQANEAVAHDECVASVPHVNEWLQRVRNARAQGEAVLADVEALSGRLNSLCEISRAVKAQSDHLSANASSLMVRKAKLEHVQEALQHHIRKFTKVEDLVREAEHPLLSAASARFPLLLQEMEDIMGFLTENHNLKSAKPYAAKLALAQQRALVCLREAVCATFQQAQSTVASSSEYTAVFRTPTNIPLIASSVTNSSGVAPSRSAVSQVISSEGAEAGGEADKLRALLATLNDSFTTHLDGAPASQRRLVEARCVSVEEDVHLSDILASYRDCRTHLLFPILRDWLESAASSQDSVAGSLGGYATLVCSFLADAMVEEQSLYDTIWLRDDICRSWDALARDIGEELYHCFRARLLQTDDLEDLSEVVRALQQSTQLHASATAASSEYATLVKRMVQDTQERIVFRVSVYLRSVIGSRRIGADEPRMILQRLLPKKRTNEDGSDAVVVVADTDNTAVSAGGPDDVVDGGLTTLTAQHHPSLEACFKFLNMLYPAVERPVFSVFADECIHMTLTFLSKLVKSIQQQSHVATIAPLIGSLYHLHHLLLLRETVTRYDVNLSTESKRLDLTQLVQRKMEIIQSSRESRKDIESDMKHVCEDIINSLVKDIVRTVKGLTASQQSPVDEAYRLVQEADQLMARFIPSGSTRSVLIRPIQARVDEELSKHPNNTTSGTPMSPLGGAPVAAYVGSTAVSAADETTAAAATS
jgi:conserved oligomeric Golgi complex subunit 3